MAFNLLINGLDCGPLCFVEDGPLQVVKVKENVLKRLINEVSSHIINHMLNNSRSGHN